MSRVPRPIVSVHGGDVDVEVHGILTARATFLSEGLFDESAGGDPDEEDLYEVEITHARDALIEPITFFRLSASAPEDLLDELAGLDAGAEPAAELPMERFLRILAWELTNADPTNWIRICEAARGWDPWMIEDALMRIPPEWTPQTLLPDED